MKDFNKPNITYHQEDTYKQIKLGSCLLQQEIVPQEIFTNVIYDIYDVKIKAGL